MMSVVVLVALDAKSDQILGSVTAQSASRLNVMDLKILHPSASLATPAISLQDFTTEPVISFGIKPQPWALGADIRAGNANLQRRRQFCPRSR
jgi:hypothetical protein